MTVLEAMAKEEGWGGTDPDGSPNRPTRNNNPGDLEFGNFAAEHGATGSDGRFAIFPDPAAGWAAMRALLIEKYQGLTVVEALNKYAPPKPKPGDPNGPPENNTSVYVQRVCEWAGVRSTEMLDDVLG